MSDQIVAKLNKWADFLETLEPEQFEMDSWVTEFDPSKTCGTVCCAGGWLPAIFPETKAFWKNQNPAILSDFIGISDEQWMWITQPMEYHNRSGIKIHQVVRRIRFLAQEIADDNA